MVRFEDKKLIIEIPSYTPVETWTDLHRGLCSLIGNVKSDTIDDESFYLIADFLEALMPEWNDAKKMKV